MTPNTPTNNNTDSDIAPSRLLVPSQLVSSSSSPGILQQPSQPVQDEVATAAPNTNNSKTNDDVDYRQTIPCRFYNRGYCKFGNSCFYAHCETIINTTTVATAMNNDFCQPCTCTSTCISTSKPIANTSNNNSSSNTEDDKINTQYLQKHNIENIHSELYECGICFENIITNHKKFGLLSNCSHVFCLDCIMTWRDSYKQPSSGTINDGNNTNRNDNDQNDTANGGNDGDNARSSGTNVDGTITSGNESGTDNRSTTTNTNTATSQAQASSSRQSNDDDDPIQTIHQFIEFLENQISNTVTNNNNNNNNNNTKQQTHTCPICRISSKHIIPSYEYYKDHNDKMKYFESYKQEKNKIRCKFFQVNGGNGGGGGDGVVFGSCPFGRDCYYGHFDENGNDVKDQDYRKGSRRGDDSSRNGNSRNTRRGGDNDDRRGRRRRGGTAAIASISLGGGSTIRIMDMSGNGIMDDSNFLSLRTFSQMLDMFHDDGDSESGGGGDDRNSGGDRNSGRSRRDDSSGRSDNNDAQNNNEEDDDDDDGDMFGFMLEQHLAHGMYNRMRDERNNRDNQEQERDNNYDSDDDRLLSHVSGSTLRRRRRTTQQPSPNADVSQNANVLTNRRGESNNHEIDQEEVNFHYDHEEDNNNGDGDGDDGNGRINNDDQSVRRLFQPRSNDSSDSDDNWTSSSSSSTPLLVERLESHGSSDDDSNDERMSAEMVQRRDHDVNDTDDQDDDENDDNGSTPSLVERANDTSDDESDGTDNDLLLLNLLDA